MKEIRTTVLIEAAPATVWEVLTGFAQYPEWNPFMTSVAGTPAVNDKLTITFAPIKEGSKPMTIQPTVLVARENKELRWLGKVLFTGLFDAEHFFELEAKDSGRKTLLVHGEVFTGMLIELFEKALVGGVEEKFGEMNAALKKRAERLQQDKPPPVPEPRERIDFGRVLRG